MYKTLIMYSLILAVVLFGGCRKDIDAHYARPDYLLGNTYEFLEKRGEFTLFLDAVDRAGFKAGLNGSGLFTVFAPSDEAVKTYLTKIGKASLAELTSDELFLLVGYHIVEFSYTKEDFLGFTKTATSEKPEEPDGYAHRFKTLAREGVRERIHPTMQNPINIFQREKFLPVISTTLLQEKRIPDPEADYKFFFPDVNWKGNVDQFYVAGSSILESGIPADNGYVYIVDKVIEPLVTVYDVFDERDDYLLFRKMYDRFALFEYDQESTTDYAENLGDSLFLMRHYLRPSNSADLPDIADEWTVDLNNSDFEARMRTTFNAYVPNNESIEAFCNEYFANEKDPMKIPLLPLFYLLSSHVPYDDEIVLPSDLDKGIEGVFGEKWPLQKSDVSNQKFCSNGIFYGINKVLKPAIFSMLTEPLFKYDRFSTSAVLFHKTQNILPLVDIDRDYTLLLISDEILRENYGYSLDYNGNPGDLDILGNRIKVFRYRDWVEESFELVNMEPHEQVSFVKTHTIEGFVDNSHIRRQFFATREPFTYIYQDNGNIYDEQANQLDIVEGGRSDIYTYEGGTGKGLVYEIKSKLEKKKENIAKALQSHSDYVKFYQALVRANLITFEGLGDNGDITPTTRFKMDWLSDERTMVFVPTNDAFDEGRLPTDSLALDRYLKFHFVSTVQNGLDQYTLPQLGSEELFETKCLISLSIYEKLKVEFVSGDTKRLRISNTGSDDVTNTTYTDGKIPFFAVDGLIYGIVDMIMPEPLTIE